MDTTERARLRALCEGIAMPLDRAQTDSSAIEISDAEGVYVGSVDVDYGLGIDGSESTEAHAALIVGAVNALPALLDALDAADRAAELAEGKVAALRAEVERLRAEVEELSRSAQMACQSPPDGCDCAGCAFADEMMGGSE